MFGTATNLVIIILAAGALGVWYATHPKTVKRLIEKQLKEKTRY